MIANKLTASRGSVLGAESLKNPETRKTLALLGAFCLFLSTIEFMIPKPLPFMRIGIANLPLMLALDIFPFPAFLALVGIKILGQAIITGTLFSYIFLFSLVGTSLAAVSMYILRRLLGPRRVTFIGVSTAGAMISNVSQMTLAWLFLFGNSARFITPPFLLAGLLTGITLGVFCEVFTRHSKWYSQRARKVW